MPDFIESVKDDPLQLVTRRWEISRDFQMSKFDEYWRAYQDYKGNQDMTGKDPYLAYPVSPLPYAIIESQTARDIASLFNATPWIPLGADLEENSNEARDFQDGLQCLLEKGKFRKEMTIAGKARRLYGLSYIEPMPTFVDITVPETEMETFEDIPLSVNEVNHIVKRFRFKFNTFMPWDILRDPYAIDLKSSRWIIKQSMVSKKQLLKQALAGDFGDDYNIEGLRNAAESGRALHEDRGQEMRRRLGLGAPDPDPDIGLLLRFESPDRFIDVLDFTTVLRDQPNPFIHGQVNLAALINNYDPNSAMRFDGIGEMKPIEATVALHNMSLAQLVNNHSLQNHKVLLYQKGKVAPDQLQMRPGGRVEVTGLLPGQSLQSAVQELVVSPLPRDAYAMPQVFEGHMRIATGVFEGDQGQQGKSSTATDSALRRQQSDSRKSMTISMFEWELGDIAELCFSHMEQFMEVEDWGSIIGAERASTMAFKNPNHIPGGCTYHFTGKDRTAEQLVRRRELAEVIGLIGPVPTLVKKALQLQNFSEREIEQVVQELAAQQAAAAEAAERSKQAELEQTFSKKRAR